MNKQAYEDFQKEVARLATDTDHTHYEAALRTQSAISEYAKQTAQAHCVPRLSDNKTFNEFRAELKQNLFE